MPIDPVLARGLPAIDLFPSMARNRQQNVENQRQNALLNLDQQKADAYQQSVQGDQQAAQRKQGAESIKMFLASAVASQDPVAAFKSGLPHFAQGWSETFGGPPIDWNEIDTPDEVQTLAYGAGVERPPQPKAPESFNLSPGGQHFTMGPDGKPIQDAYAPPNPTEASQNKPPSGYMWTPSGTLAPIPGGPAFGKAPSGYRLKSDGTDGFEPVPGGPVDIKIKEQKAREFTAKRTVSSTADREIANIDALIGSEDGKKGPHPGLKSMLGVIDVKFPTILQDTKDAEALLNSLKSKTAIGALRDIRAGGSGSVGAITEREWPILENMKVALDPGQGVQQFTQNLKEYRDELLRMKREAQAVDVSSIGSEQPQASDQPPPGVDPALWAVMTPDEKAAWR